VFRSGEVIWIGFEEGVDGIDDFVELFFDGDKFFLLLLKEVFFE
jgi:hypothetical protein